jgi:hypothetical protein
MFSYNAAESGVDFAERVHVLNGKVSDGENVQQHFVGTLKKE